MNEHLGFTLSRPELRPTPTRSVWPIDELTRWTISEVGGLNPASFVTPRRISFRSFDKRTIPAYYSRLAAPHVNIRFRRDQHSWWSRRPIPSLLLRHHAVLCQRIGSGRDRPNVRGSSGYGKTYLKLDNAELREDSVKDIGGVAGLDCLAAGIGCLAVAVSGGSYGGYMVLASLRILAIASRPASITWGSPALRPSSKTRPPIVRICGAPNTATNATPKMRAVFERINPLANADKIVSALLVAHGENDPRVPFSEAKQIADKVRSRGRSVWTVYANNEGHGFAKKDNADYLRAVEVLFLQHHLARQDPPPC